ncbi:MAG: helix-turn-helix domain-containing protein [Paracoccaceae bacterium]
MADDIPDPGPHPGPAPGGTPGPGAAPDPGPGARLRARRLDLGLSQRALAADLGISPSYLNLIEHGRRPLGPAHLRAASRALSLDPAGLSEGPSPDRVSRLRAAAAALPGAGAEAPRAPELADRLPGWAALVEAQAARIAALEGQLQALADPLGRDPSLAASLHDMIGAVTAIRSSASILTGEEGLDADWRRRFAANIDDDARRLSDRTAALLTRLDGSAAEGVPLSPLEEADAHPPGGDPTGLSAPARAIVAARDERRRADAAWLPLDRLAPVARACDHDPARIARRLAVPADVLLRRIAELPEDQGHPPHGLMACDGAGVVTQLRPFGAFAPPRAGGCPLWPLYAALQQPGRPLRATVALPGAPGAHLDCHAVAAPRAPARWGSGQAPEAVMIVRPTSDPGPDPVPVGPGCRICPRARCEARREPSLLADAAL